MRISDWSSDVCSSDLLGIAQAVLLIEEAGVRAGLLIVPGAPFVDIERDALVGIVFVHDRRMFGDEFVHVQRVDERRGPGGLVDAGRGAVVLPRAGEGDRKSVWEGMGGLVRVLHGWGGMISKRKIKV